MSRDFFAPIYTLQEFAEVRNAINSSSNILEDWYEKRLRIFAAGS